MVIHCIPCTGFLVLADSSTATGLERLDPPTRARVVMALLGLVLLAVTLVACVMIGGRWVRRLARHSPRSVAPKRQASRTADSKLSVKGALGPTCDTLAGEQRTDETRTD